MDELHWLDIPALLRACQGDRDQGNIYPTLVHLALGKRGIATQLQCAWVVDKASLDSVGSMVGVKLGETVFRLDESGDWEILKDLHCQRHGNDPSLYSTVVEPPYGENLKSNMLGFAQRMNKTLQELDEAICQQQACFLERRVDTATPSVSKARF